MPSGFGPYPASSHWPVSTGTPQSPREPHLFRRVQSGRPSPCLGRRGRHGQGVGSGPVPRGYDPRPVPKDPYGIADLKAKRQVAISPTGSTLAVLEYDRVRLWDIRSEKSLTEDNPTGAEAQSLTFSPDGRTLTACVGGDPGAGRSLGGGRRPPVPETTPRRVAVTRRREAAARLAPVAGALTPSRR